jgi:hypothetical protein
MQGPSFLLLCMTGVFFSFAKFQISHWSELRVSWIWHEGACCWHLFLQHRTPRRYVCLISLFLSLLHLSLSLCCIRPWPLRYTECCFYILP